MNSPSWGDPKALPTIRTFGGHYFNFADPGASPIGILDIAVGLGNTCRFGGQCGRFYSVAEHCVLASQVAPDPFKFDALMHDAAEAFVGDMPKPLKEMLPDYRRIENRVAKATAERFNFAHPVPPEVKKVDRQMLAAEQRQVMGCTDDWHHTHGAQPADVTIRFLPPVAAAQLFLERFNCLQGTSFTLAEVV